MKVTTIKDNFLTPELKKLKQEIMEKLMDGLWKTINDNRHLLTDKSSTDIITSCLIMFNRDSFSHFFLNSNFPAHWKSIYRQISNIIEDEIQTQIKMENKNDNH